jgi:predicted MFS family arabinose efflux permease
MSEQEVARKRPASLWRNRDYVLLVSGQGVSDMGTQVSDLAFILLILALTGSPAQVGFVIALRALPSFILSIPAGALVDRWDRRRLMILCDVGRALCMSSIPIAFALGYRTMVQLYLVALIEATFAVFFDFSTRASLPRIVTKEQLPTAVAQSQSITYTSLLLGPPLSGALYSVGRAFPFLADAVSYVVSVISLLFIKTPFQEERSAAPGKLWVEVKEGFVWLWQHPLLRFMTLLVGGLNLTVAGIDLIVVVLAQHLGASSFTIGLVIAAGSIGGLAGAFIAPFIQRRLSYGQAMISVCWATALLWPLFAIARNLAVIGIIFAAYLIWGRIMNVVNFSYRTALTPNRMQGRVIGISGLIVRICPPLGIALTGILIQSAGVVPTILIITGCRVALAIATTLNSHVRNAPPIAEVQAV